MKVGSASFAPSQSQQKYIILPRNVQKTTATTTTIATTTTKNTWRQGRRKTTRQQEHIPSHQKWAVSVSKLPSGCARGGLQHGKPWHDVSTLQLTGHNYKRHRLETNFLKAHIQKTSTSHIHGPKHVNIYIYAYKDKYIYIYTHASIMYTCYTWWTAQSSKTYLVLQTLFWLVECGLLSILSFAAATPAVPHSQNPLWNPWWSTTTTSKKNKQQTTNTKSHVDRNNYKKKLRFQGFKYPLMVG